MTQDTIERRLEAVESRLEDLSTQSEARGQDVDRIHARIDTSASKTDIHEVRDDMRAMSARLDARMDTLTIIVPGGVTLGILGIVATVGTTLLTR